GQKKCGLKNLTVVDPAPAVGPRHRVIKVNLWHTGPTRDFGVASDEGALGLVRGFLSSKKIADRAQTAGLKKVKLDDDEQGQLDQLLEEDDWVRATLDASRAFAPPQTGPWLASLRLPAKGPVPLVLLLDPEPTASAGSVFQVSTDSNLVFGGYTFVAQNV